MEVVKVRLADSDLVRPADAELLAPAYPDLGPAPVEDDRILEGISLYHQGRFDDARNVLASMVFEEPSQWLAYYFLGMVDYGEGQYSEAEKGFEAALVFCPEDNESRAMVYSALGLTLEKAGDFGRATQHFLTAYNLNPKSLRAQTGLVRVTSFSAVDDR